jgi:hypothetical protein
MNAASRRPGTSTTFVDASSEEEILQLAADEDGRSFMAFHLYDSVGNSVAESQLEHFDDGISVSCAGGELLLSVPRDPGDSMQYRLYNSEGYLLTSSDGVRTRIYPLLRMEGVRRLWAVPAVPVATVPTALESPPALAALQP